MPEGLWAALAIVMILEGCPAVRLAAPVARHVQQAHRAHRRPDPLRRPDRDSRSALPHCCCFAMRNWLLPEHVEDVLPAEAEALERLRRKLLDHLMAHGYRLVQPPLVEHLESLLTGSARDLDLQTFKVVDPLSGRLLGVRADITPQVARIDAHLLNDRRRQPALLCRKRAARDARAAGHDARGRAGRCRALRRSLDRRRPRGHRAAPVVARKRRPRGPASGSRSRRRLPRACERRRHRRATRGERAVRGDARQGRSRRARADRRSCRPPGAMRCARCPACTDRRRRCCPQHDRRFPTSRRSRMR